jgi:hypothetical protein
MKKLDEFNKTHDATMQHIRDTLSISPDSYDFSMVALVKWMLETTSNPYAYVPGRAGLLSSAVGFESLINELHHALYDDGDMEFVSVNGEPRIVFAWRFDDNFTDRCLTDTERMMAAQHGTTYEVNVLDITPEEFTQMYDAFESEHLKKCYVHDAARHGVAFADSHYKVYTCWTPQWKDELADRIEAMAQLFTGNKQ